MKLRVLTSTMIMVLGASTLQSHAVYNLYKKDGLSLDVNGEINVHFKNDRKQYTYQYDQPGTIGAPQYDYSLGQWVSPQILVGAYEERTDRRTRLGHDDGASWLDIRGSQKLPQDWRVTGTVGFGYADSGTGMYLNSANLAFDKLNTGSISLGRQYLHSGYVTRTGTFTTLETFAAASIRADYTAIPNLHLSAYYNTPSSPDVRNNSSREVEGFGASLSYRLPMSQEQNLRFAAGYSDSRANPNLSTRSGNQVAIDSKGYAGSVEYRHAQVLAALDLGGKKEDLNGTVTDSAKTDFFGVKVGYQFTPRFSLTAGHGKKDITRDNKQGVQVVANAARDATNVAYAYESFLFPKTEEKRSYVRADYYLRENVRLYGRVDNIELQHQLDGKDYAKLEDTAYRAGVSFTF
ncbi:hypothetical protein [Moraxella canis]|uniref:Porin domain-containing protein n=1 Tax=Moraxella canis TaxID=90239 RepID=A0A1S9ZHJ5_9GAMM|nr:hypothetical protein [Moraxella canis]OOR82870.1 hypothetical protein B0180_08275 [Moraxella canis]